MDPKPGTLGARLHEIARQQQEINEAKRRAEEAEVRRQEEIKIKAGARVMANGWYDKCVEQAKKDAQTGKTETSVSWERSFYDAAASQAMNMVAERLRKDDGFMHVKTKEWESEETFDKDYPTETIYHYWITITL